MYSPDTTTLFHSTSFHWHAVFVNIYKDYSGNQEILHFYNHFIF